MVWADYVILAVILVSALISLWRGFMREAISLATWIIAFWIAISFADLLALRFTDWIDTPSLRIIVAFAILFFAVLILGAMVNHFVGIAVERTGLSGTDRFIGLFFGTVRGIVVVAVLVLMGMVAKLPRDQWWQDSLLIPVMEPVAGWLEGFLPSGVREDIPDPETVKAAGELLEKS